MPYEWINVSIFPYTRLSIYPCKIDDRITSTMRKDSGHTRHAYYIVFSTWLTKCFCYGLCKFKLCIQQAATGYCIIKLYASLGWINTYAQFFLFYIGQGWTPLTMAERTLCLCSIIFIFICTFCSGTDQPFCCKHLQCCPWIKVIYSDNVIVAFWTFWVL